MILRSARAACGWLLPLHGQGRHGIVPPKALDIADICVLQIRIPHHTFGRRHPQRFLSNAASFNDRLMTTAEAPGAFSLGKGRFDLLIRERRVHPLQPLLLDGRGATGTADESSQCSRFKYVVGLTLCSTQFGLVVS